MSLKPFLRSGTVENRRCNLCNGSIDDNTDVSKVATAGLQSLKALAERWAKVDRSLCCEPPYTEFQLAAPRLLETQSDIIVHDSCRITFRNRLRRKEVQSSKTMQPSCSKSPTESSGIDPTTSNRIRRGSLHQNDICFVCYTKTSNDSKPFNDGGLGRCSEDNAFSKIKSAMDLRIKDEKHRHNAAAKRLEIILSGPSYDVFAVDLYYHKICYANFTYIYDRKQPTTDAAEKGKIGEVVMDSFFKLFQRSVIKDQEAYLMTELLEDIKEMSNDNGLDDPPVTKTCTLKKELLKEFNDLIDFHMIGNRLVVHSSAVNPLLYTSATITGHGLRETDLTKAFSRLIRRKISQRQTIKWPLEPQEFFNLLETHKPLQCIYNAICWSINPKRSTNAFGFVTVPSKVEAERISAISQSWEKMVTGERSPLGTALSLTIHRITGSKEATTLLNRCGVGIPYTDVRDLNNSWARSVTMEHKGMLPPGFVRGRSVHITFDNSDGKQQTITGAHTTHHTTGTIFQARHPDDNEVVPSTLEHGNIVDHDEPDYGFFKIPKKRAPPPSFPDFGDGYRKSKLLDDALGRNIAWVLLSSVGDHCLEKYYPEVEKDELGPVGSWTSFMKRVTDCSTTKCKLEYLPVVPLPPGDSVIKWYMDMIVQIADDLDLQYIFAHADEAINSKMLMISWLNQERYDKIIPILGGFHTILVNLKILFKKYRCLGLSDWWVDAGAIAEGSAAQAFEGRHYARSVRLHKQSLEALLRHRIDSENIESKLDVDMKEVIAKLRHNASPENLNLLLGLPGFKDICSLLLRFEGTQAQMIVEYIKDVSAMLCLISAVREKSIETHLAAERALLPKCFAFDHTNYARYLTFQHVNLQNIKANRKDAWDHLVQNGFGGSMSGEPFSTKHGDLITETTINREVKVRGGPMRGGYSTNEQITDKFIKTSHIIAKLRTILKERLNMLTTSSHKETTLGARRMHENMICALVLQLDKYFDPFLTGPARHLKTGVEIDHSIISGLLSSTEAGEKQYKDFVKLRLTAKEGRVNFFDKIVKLKIKTGQERVSKNAKAVNILKEDCQAFGLLVGKATSPKEAHSFPLTTVPLALATPERDLRQGSKAALRNYLMAESLATCEEPPDGGNWLIDGMAAVKSIPPQDTWEQYADALLEFCFPPSQSKPSQLGLIFDSYSTATTKELTQRRRGIPGRRIHITSAEQSMPKGKDWDLFLNNTENKSGLIQFLVDYYKTDSVRCKLKVPLTVTEERKTWLITQTDIQELEACNHHEADTRLVLHASKSKDPVIVRATDTDVLVLLSYAYSICKPEKGWFMKVDHRYVNVEKISTNFGEEICEVLPAYHSITGCDTTSFPYGIGKIKPFKKMLSHKKWNLLLGFGKSIHSDGDITRAKCFFRTCMYPGTDQETFVETRIRMYNKKKVKSSSSILPDESSTDEHIKRSLLQAMIWYQCLEPNIEYPSVTDKGWKKTEDGIRPIWFTCPQLPPSLSVKKNKRRKLKGQDDYDADADETNEERDQPLPKKRRTGASNREELLPCAHLRKGRKQGAYEKDQPPLEESDQPQPRRRMIRVRHRKEASPAHARDTEKYNPDNIATDAGGGKQETTEGSDQPPPQKCSFGHGSGQKWTFCYDCSGDDENTVNEDSDFTQAPDATSDIPDIYSSTESDNYSDLDISE